MPLSQDCCLDMPMDYSKHTTAQSSFPAFSSKIICARLPCRTCAAVLAPLYSFSAMDGTKSSPPDPPCASSHIPGTPPWYILLATIPNILCVLRRVACRQTEICCTPLRNADVSKQDLYPDIPPDGFLNLPQKIAMSLRPQSSLFRTLAQRYA